MIFKCRHANSHFEVEDEQLAKDLEFAQQLAFAPSSPPSMVSILSPLLLLLLFCIALPIQIRRKKIGIIKLYVCSDYLNLCWPNSMKD